MKVSLYALPFDISKDELCDLIVWVLICPGSVVGIARSFELLPL